MNEVTFNGLKLEMIDMWCLNITIGIQQTNKIIFCTKTYFKYYFDTFQKKFFLRYETM